MDIHSTDTPPCVHGGDSSVQVTRLQKSPNHDSVLNSIIAMERRLWKKSESWGPLVGKEAQRRNTFIFYAAQSQADQQPSSTNARVLSATTSPSEDRQRVVGYIFFTVSGLVSHISKLIVVADCRRRGIGRRLLQAAIEFSVKERRAVSLSLHVDPENEAAIQLYKNMGFLVDGLLEVGSICYYY